MAPLALLLAVSAWNVEAGTRSFAVEGRHYIGVGRPVCTITGKWDDGEPLRYEAWDSCRKLTIKRVAPQPNVQVVKQVHGMNRTFTVPAGREGLLVGNGDSQVWLYRNKRGGLEEILISD